MLAVVSSGKSILTPPSLNDPVLRDFVMAGFFITAYSGIVLYRGLPYGTLPLYGKLLSEGLPYGMLPLYGKLLSGGLPYGTLPLYGKLLSEGLPYGTLPLYGKLLSGGLPYGTLYIPLLLCGIDTCGWPSTGCSIVGGGELGPFPYKSPVLTHCIL